MKLPVADRFALAQVGLLALSWPSPARATPAELFGAGPRSVALAGAGASLDLGAESTLQNPALLASVRQRELQAGIYASRFVLELEREGVAEPLPAQASKGFYFGAAVPLATGNVRWAFGLFAASPPELIVRARRPFEEEPDFPLLVGRSQAFDLGAGLAARVGPWSFGVGLRVLASLSGSVRVEEQNGTQTEVVSNELVPAYAPVFGAAVEAGAGFSLGLSVRTALRSDFDVTLETPDLAGIALVPLHIQGVAHYEPLRASAEVSRRFGAWTALVALGYERWSDLPAAVGATVRCPPTRETCGTVAPPDPDATDVFVPRMAGGPELALDRLRLTLRAGYAYVPSALAEQRGRANSFDATRHAFALGYSLRLRAPLPPLRLDGAFRLDLLVPRTHEKQSPGVAAVTTRGLVETFLFGAGLEL